MNKSLVLASVIAVSGATLADDHPKSAADWFLEDYASLWESDPGDKATEIASHYAESLMSHSADGGVDVSNARVDLVESIDGWLEEDWVSSRAVNVETDELNPTTAVFKAKWLDVYADGSEEFSCGWYLADLQDGKWSFTVYADIDCDAHDL